MPLSGSYSQVSTASCRKPLISGWFIVCKMQLHVDNQLHLKVNYFISSPFHAAPQTHIGLPLQVSQCLYLSAF